MLSTLGGLIKNPLAKAETPAEEGKTNDDPPAEPTQSRGATMLSKLPSMPSWMSRGNTETTPAAAAAVEGGAEGSTEGTGEGNVSKVKNLGSFLVSTIKATGQKIKDNTHLNLFQDLTESVGYGKSPGALPWVGHPEEEKLKEEILGLSSDKRNFVRSPPVEFPFDWETIQPTAAALLDADPALAKMRFDLVPKLISEDVFWRNYFYRVHLLGESLGVDKGGRQESSSEEEELAKDLDMLDDAEDLK